MKKWISEKYSVDVEQVIIDYIFTRTGVCESKVKAKVLKEKPKKEEPKEKKEEQKENKEEAKEAKKEENNNEAQNNTSG